MSPQPTTARDVAVHALRDRAGNVTAHLERLLDEGRLESADRSLAMELTFGTLRRKGTLAALLAAFLKSPGRKLPGPVGEILLVGAYQLVYCERIPDFAAVNEAVEQAVRFGHKRQSGLVNGVLRNLARDLGEATDQPEPLAEDVVLLSGRRGRRVDRAVFANPQQRPAEYLAAAFSLPDELARRWLEQFGSVHKAAEVAAASNGRPPMIARVNSLHADLDTVTAQLRLSGCPTTLHSNGRSLVLHETADITALAAFAQGLFQPQDPTATEVVEALDPRPGEAILDFCAAPGTKTGHIGEKMQNRGQITALDVTDGKCQLISENCHRLGIHIVEAMLADRASTLQPQSYDRALVDAPCSNTGVLARRPEARWRFSQQRLGELAGDQKQLAALAAQLVRPGGTLVYSTCSIEPEENQQVAQWLHENPNVPLKLEEQKLTLPHGADDPASWHDGGYRAIFTVR